ncbi:MAG: amidohydrolase, partial [Calditrichaeota bacterium]|nr:amidohydrolase [Calditrichota bacterium]
MQAEIRQLIEKNKRVFTAYREYFHQHPELSWQETETIAYIKAKLNEWGLNYTEAAGTGLFGDIVFSSDGPTLAYRADIDALPIDDGKDVPYKSQNPGVCHSCGHDFHTATLLSTIQLITELKPKLKGTFRFIFQPAEEVTPGGALSMIEAGCLNGVDHIIAMHSEPNLPIGEIGVVRGWVTTQSVTYKIKIHGKGGHSARPYQAIDPIFVATSIIQNIYAATERRNSFYDFFVFSMCKIHSGTKANVIPDDCEMEGSLRLTNPDKMQEVTAFIDQIINDQAKLMGAKVEIEKIVGDPPVVNDKDFADQVAKILEPVFGFEKIHDDTRTMGGEDFSNYQRHVPGCYIRFGIANDKLNYSLH